MTASRRLLPALLCLASVPAGAATMFSFPGRAVQASVAEGKLEVQRQPAEEPGYETWLATRRAAGRAERCIIDFGSTPLPVAQADRVVDGAFEGGRSRNRRLIAQGPDYRVFEGTTATGRNLRAVIYRDAAGTTRTITRLCDGATTGIAITFTPQSQAGARPAAPPARPTPPPSKPAPPPAPKPVPPPRVVGGLPLSAAEQRIMRCHSGYTLAGLVQDAGIRLPIDPARYRQRRAFWGGQLEKMIMDRMQRLLGGADATYDQAVAVYNRRLEAIVAQDHLSVTERYRQAGDLALQEMRACE